MKRIFIAAIASLFALTAIGATLNPVQLLNPAGSTSGQTIVSTGASSAPAWGNVSAAGLAAQAANTVLANATAASASPTAFAMPSCSTSASSLTWTTSTGFTCNTAVNAAQLGGTTFAAPGAIGGTTPAAGAFTTLSASANSAVFSTNTSAQSIPNGAFTTVTGWTAVTDRNSNWTASTGTFTAPRAGMYMVSAALATAAVSWGANNNLSIAVFKNGTEVAQATKIIDAANGATTQGVALPSVVISCAASDALTIRVFQSQGAAVALGSTAVTNWVSIVQVP
jgi:hypothetical protein